MSLSSRKIPFQENFLRQAKRLSSRLSVSLSVAKGILARGPYRCANWFDLSTRFNDAQIQNHQKLLASLPLSNESKEYFLVHIQELARSVAQQILTNENLIGLHEILKYVFGMQDLPFAIKEWFPAINHGTWESEHIGPDKFAVISTYATVNNIPFKLLGTRVYLPEYFEFGKEYSDKISSIIPAGECFKIIWSNQNAWYEATLRYLAAEDQSKEELKLPETSLNEAMCQHERWFNSCLSTWDSETAYQSEWDNFLPHFLFGGCYLIFGFPINSNDAVIKAVPSTLKFSFDSQNESQMVLVEENPFCVEWISANTKNCKHEGEFDEYFQLLLSGLFSHKDCNMDQFFLNGWDRSIFFLRPASQFDINEQLRVEFRAEIDQEAFVLKTDHPEVVSALLEKIASDDIYCLPCKNETQEYIVEIDMSHCNGVKGFSLSLDVLGENFVIGRHLTTGAFFLKNVEKTILYLTFDYHFLTLFEMEGKRTLNDAAQFGLVLHRPIGFGKKIDQKPKKFDRLKAATPELISILDGFLNEMKLLSTDDLFFRLKPILFKRYNS